MLGSHMGLKNSKSKKKMKNDNIKKDYEMKLNDMSNDVPKN